MKETVIDTLSNENLQNLIISDASIFLTSVVSLQLVHKADKLGKEIIIWKNPKASQ